MINTIGSITNRDRTTGFGQLQPFDCDINVNVNINNYQQQTCNNAYTPVKLQKTKIAAYCNLPNAIFIRHASSYPVLWLCNLNAPSWFVRKSENKMKMILINDPDFAVSCQLTLWRRRWLDSLLRNSNIVAYFQRYFYSEFWNEFYIYSYLWMLLDVML